MEARELENGNLLAPMAAEGPDGALFDGMFGIGPDHPDYEKWRPFIGVAGQQMGRSDAPRPEAG